MIHCNCWLTGYVFCNSYEKSWNTKSLEQKINAVCVFFPIFHWWWKRTTFTSCAPIKMHINDIFIHFLTFTHQTLNFWMLCTVHCVQYSLFTLFIHNFVGFEICALFSLTHSRFCILHSKYERCDIFPSITPNNTIWIVGVLYSCLNIAFKTIFSVFITQIDQHCQELNTFWALFSCFS